LLQLNDAVVFAKVVPGAEALPGDTAVVTVGTVTETGGFT
jgi:hypothetical protein